MIANVIKGAITRGRVTAGLGSDTYVFELDRALRWVYKGKHVADTFIPVDVQGYEHIPQEFFKALDAAWCDPNGYYEFEDPYETLEVQGA